MGELTSQERLQPSLLDRLTDDAPAQADESRDARVISAQRLRECVIRDLSWLLNCTHAEAAQPLDATPRVATSVLNYGIPDFTGIARSGLDAAQLERRLRTAILAFEPRLIADTLQVRVRVDQTRMDDRSLVFDIQSDMWAQPIPLNLYLKTEVDLETGRMTVSEAWS
jgi:type VI secretion system protein ImpF